MSGLIRVRRAIVTVNDKPPVLPLARVLSGYGVEIFSTDATAAFLRESNIGRVHSIPDYTDFPEILGGRVKTLHPKIHGGLLALRDDPSHQADLKEHGILEFDLMVNSMYGFEDKIQMGEPEAECVANIDIGGPANLRSAAKNYKYVAVVPCEDDYPVLIQELSRHGGGTTLEFRREMARKTFWKTSAYDARISYYLLDLRHQK